MSVIDASKGRWAQIYNALGLPRIHPTKHYPEECPLCGRKNKLRIDDRSGDGDWICVCDHGKGLKMVQEVFQISFQEAVDKVAEIIGYKESYVKPEGFKSKIDLAEEKFGSCFKGHKELDSYFSSRGLMVRPSSDAVRYSPMESYDMPKQLKFPAMLAKVLSHTGLYVYSHYTYIFNGKKITLDPDRKLYSNGSDVKGASCRLFEHNGVLGVAEGIETAMSTTQIYGVPTWSCINTTILKKFVAPKGVHTLIIFADNDQNLSGQSAAFDCARRNMLAINDLKKINIVWPAISGHDFNDSLVMGKHETIIHKFSKDDTKSNSVPTVPKLEAR